ncbi:MAG: ComF family protein [Clostridia bacterium]|nr:ComF family protein [Clostridia bacterium]
MYGMIKALDRMASLVFPPRCAVCGSVLAERDAPLCGVCLERWLCERAEYDGSPKADIEGVKRSYHLAFYTPSRMGERTVADTLAYSMKSGGSGSVYPFLARQMCQRLYMSAVDGRREPKDEDLRRLAGFFDIVSYIPRSRKNALRFGVDQSAMLARGISELTGIPAARLFVNASDKTQHELTEEERRENMSKLRLRKGAEDEIRGARVILIDDIVTTGATVSSAASLAASAGASEIILIAPFRTRGGVQKHGEKRDPSERA